MYMYVYIHARSEKQKSATTLTHTCHWHMNTHTHTHTHTCGGNRDVALHGHNRQQRHFGSLLRCYRNVRAAGGRLVHSILARCGSSTCCPRATCRRRLLLRHCGCGGFVAWQREPCGHELRRH